MSQRWESMFRLAALNTECVSITYSPMLLFCLQEQSSRVSHQCPIYLDKCFLHNLTLHVSVTLVLIRERLNWGKVKMEHTAIKWLWSIIHVAQCAVSMNTQHHGPEQDTHCRPKDFIFNCWRERIWRARFLCSKMQCGHSFYTQKHPLSPRSCFSLAWVTTWCKKLLRDHLCLIRMLRTPIDKNCASWEHLQNYRPTHYGVRLLPQHEARSLSQWVYHAGSANY